MLGLKSKPLAADKSDKIGRVLVFIYLALFFCFLVLPLFALMSKSMQNAEGVFVGLENFKVYLKDPALFKSFFHSLFVAFVSTVIVVCLGFLYALALQCTCIPLKGFFRVVSLIPLLSPSILAAIALVYWFGNQGVFKELLLGNSIYGPIGIIMASVYWTFPQMIKRASENNVSLMPGDILGSGTVGWGSLIENNFSVHRPLVPGDIVELEIENIGILKNTVV